MFASRVFTIIIIAGLMVLAIGCGPAEETAMAPTPEPALAPVAQEPEVSKPELPPANTPEEGYHAYWAAWESAQSIEDMYPYLGGPEFEAMKAELEGDPNWAAMGLAMYKNMAAQGQIRKVMTISRDAERAELKALWQPAEHLRNEGVASDTEITVRMVKIDGRWLVDGEDIHDDVRISTRDIPTAPPVAARSWGGFEAVPLGAGSAWHGITPEEPFELTEGVVAYEPRNTRLNINLYGPHADIGKRLRPFEQKPGIYYEMLVMFVIHEYSEAGIRCDIREVPFDERPPEGTSLADAATYGEFVGSFSCDRVYVME
jgi:hypothetical protein